MLDALKSGITSHGSAWRTDVTTSKDDRKIVDVLKQQCLAVVCNNSYVVSINPLKHPKSNRAGVDEDAIAILNVASGFAGNCFVRANLP